MPGEPDRELPAHGERAARVPVALHGDLELLEVDAHVRGHHAQRDLLAGGQRGQQQVGRARGVVVPAHRGVRAGAERRRRAPSPA